MISISENDVFEKHPSHDHFFVIDFMLFESYMTCRGLRSNYLMDMPGEPDNDNYTLASQNN